MININIYKTKKVKTPEYGTKESAGIDFFVPDDYNKKQEKLLYPNCSELIESGIKLSIPKGYMLCAFNKSGVSLKQGLQVGAQIIDSDYQGEIHLHVINISKNYTKIIPGQKLVQFVLLKTPEVYINKVKKEQYLFNNISERAEGAFGSTGLYKNINKPDFLTSKKEIQSFNKKNKII